MSGCISGFEKSRPEPLRVPENKPQEEILLRTDAAALEYWKELHRQIVADTLQSCHGNSEDLANAHYNLQELDTNVRGSLQDEECDVPAIEREQELVA